MNDEADVIIDSALRKHFGKFRISYSCTGTYKYNIVSSSTSRIHFGTGKNTSIRLHVPYILALNLVLDSQKTKQL